MSYGMRIWNSAGKMTFDSSADRRYGSLLGIINASAGSSSWTFPGKYFDAISANDVVVDYDPAILRSNASYDFSFTVTIDDVNGVLRPTIGISTPIDYEFRVYSRVAPLSESSHSLHIWNAAGRLILSDQVDSAVFLGKAAYKESTVDSYSNKRHYELPHSATLTYPPQLFLYSAVHGYAELSEWYDPLVSPAHIDVTLDKNGSTTYIPEVYVFALQREVPAPSGYGAMVWDASGEAVFSADSVPMEIPVNAERAPSSYSSPPGGLTGLPAKPAIGASLLSYHQEYDAGAFLGGSPYITGIVGRTTTGAADFKHCLLRNGYGGPDLYESLMKRSIVVIDAAHYDQFA